MKAEQPWFPRDCDEAVTASKQGKKSCVRNDKARTMPVFGSFPGPPADPDPSFQTSDADVDISFRHSLPPKTSPSLRALNSLQVVPSNQFLSISSKSNLSVPLSLSEPCRPELEHGPLSMACAQSSATGRHGQPRFHSPRSAQHKSQLNNGDNNAQYIVGRGKQSAARSPFKTKTSNNHPGQNSFVPTLSASLPNLPNQTQRNTWLDHTDHTVGSGAFQRLAPQNIELSVLSPHEALPPRQESSLSTRTPQSGPSLLRGPRCRNSTMCQTYYKTNPPWCARPVQSCDPSTSSPPSSHFSPKTTPSTTPLSSLSSLTTPASSITTESSTHGKYNTGPPAHLKMCAPEHARDEMYYHPQSQEYLDAVTTAGSNSREEIYIPAVPMRATRQHEMRPLPPPRRRRVEVYSPPELYSPNLREFEGVSESIAAVLAPDPNISIDLVDYPDQNGVVGENTWPATPTNQTPIVPLALRDNPPNSQSDDIDQDDNAWNDILADFPTSVEDCPPNDNATFRDVYLPSEIHTAMVAGTGGATSSNTGGMEQGIAVANQAVCTLVNRCHLCAGLSYFDRLDVHPELSQRNRLPNPTLWQRDGESGPQNGFLAHLVSESEPVGWEHPGGMVGSSVWGAIGEPVPRQPQRYDVQDLRAIWAE